MTNGEFLGLLKPEEEKDFSGVLDEIIDWKKILAKKPLMGVIAEAVDGKFFTAVIINLDDRLANKIPSSYKPESRQLLLALINKDWEGVVNTAPALLNKPIDIPGIDEDTELAILAGIAQAIYVAVLAYAKAKLSNH